MPLPVERNRIAAQLIHESAKLGKLAGFSRDLYILKETSRTASHDGRSDCFYQCLRRGAIHRGYCGEPFQEIIALYRQMRDHGE